jgi:hypothetical protein
MPICAIFDANGNEIGRIIADPAIDKAADGRTLAIVSDQQLEDERTPVHDLPAFNDSASIYSSTTPAAEVLGVTRGRIITLEASRGNASFDPDVNCPAFTWAAQTLVPSDDCAAFVAKMVRDIGAGLFDASWAFDFFIVNAKLFPADQAEKLMKALPENYARLAHRTITKA